MIQNWKEQLTFVLPFRETSTGKRNALTGISQCEIAALWRNNLTHQYRLGSSLESGFAEKLESSFAEKDLGVLVDKL